eukprot:CAMPEP_0168535654 /NCGR_PEP_ID=MMETSP0405-20121227/18890_1 /TAXON_ID=498012 /ORGANISM="Trichosphaerium sp, Strain Am-I-7 wt" /LENGTH=157 /DNA_ID=CAMNT_0008563125 /DNA_START=323 /DNA_END=796 /DNA_ORIENTATION=-
MSIEGNVFKREKAISAFSGEGEEIKVLLLSTKKSASGTNLVNAKHVILLDPPFGKTEEIAAQDGQAIGRAYRLGQEEPVQVTRFVVKNTVEQDSYTKYLKEKARSSTNTERNTMLSFNNELQLVRQTESGVFSLKNPLLTFKNVSAAHNDCLRKALT